MEKTADLAMIQKTNIETLHKEGKSQRVITERGGCLQSAVSKHIKCKVDWKDTRPNNADDLKATVKETWASIPPQQCRKLITSMPRRIEAVIKAKGAPTKY